jgi:WD40 repeat protein
MKTYRAFLASRLSADWAAAEWASSIWQPRSRWGGWSPLKLVKKASLRNEDQLRRLQSEALAAARLEHPNIVAVHDTGQVGETHYFVMAYVEGTPLSTYLAENSLKESAMAQMLCKIADAIHYAHLQGVIHRDLKPSNVIVDLDGEPRVADFGLAKLLDADKDLTITGMALGTPAFMPPEQAIGDSRKVSPASDVYSIGAILYQMLVGRPPFHAANPVDTLQRVINSDPVAPRRLDPDINLDLETICLKCLEKDPKRRYASAQELSEELRRYLEHRPILARPLSRAQRALRLCRRNPGTTGAISAVLLSMLIGLIASLYFASQSAKREIVANQNLDRAESLLYETTIPTAQRWIDDGLAKVALDLLEQCRPELAGWEYRYLENSAKQTLHEHPAALMATSEDGRFLATSDVTSPSGGTLVTVSRLDDGSVQETVELDGLYPVSMDLSPDGNQLAVARIIDNYELARIEIIDIESGDVRFRSEDISSSVSRTGYSPDGKMVVFAVNNEIYRLKTGTLEMLPPIAKQKEDIRDFVFIENDKVAVASQTEIEVWNLQTGELIQKLEDAATAILDLDYDPVSNRILRCESKRLTVLEAEALQTRTVVELADNIICGSFLTGSELVAVGSNNLRMQVWNTSTGRLLAEFGRQNGPVIDIMVPKGATKLISSVPKRVDSNLNAKVLDVGLLLQKTRLSPIKKGHRVTGFAISNDASLIAFATDDDGTPAEGGSVFADLAIEVHQSNGGKMLQRISLPGRQSPTQLAFDDTARKLRWFESEHLLVEMDLKTKEITRRIPVESVSFRSVSFCRSGRYLAHYSGNTSIEFWDCETGMKKVSVPIPQNEVIGDANFSLDETTAYCGMLTGDVYEIEIETGRLTKHPVHKGFVTANAITDDGQLMATSSGRTIRLWNLESFELIREIVGHSSVVMTLSFSADGSRLVSGGDDATVRLWNVATGRELLRFSDQSSRVYQAKFAPNGEQLISLESDKLMIYTANSRKK